MNIFKKINSPKFFANITLNPIKGYICRSEEHTSELQSRPHLVCRLLLEKKNEAVSSFGAISRRSCCLSVAQCWVVLRVGVHGDTVSVLADTPLTLLCKLSETAPLWTRLA